jgi:hypothetical protein
MILMSARPGKRQKPGKRPKPIDHKNSVELDKRAARAKAPGDDIDKMLAPYGLTVPFPHGHPHRAWAAHVAIREHLYDPTSPESIARDDRIDRDIACLGLTVELPRGHALRGHAWFEAMCEYKGFRPYGRYPIKPPLPADTSTQPPEPAKKPPKR